MISAIIRQTLEATPGWGTAGGSSRWGRWICRRSKRLEHWEVGTRRTRQRDRQSPTAIATRHIHNHIVANTRTAHSRPTQLSRFVFSQNETQGAGISSSYRSAVSNCFVRVQASLWYNNYGSGRREQARTVVSTRIISVSNSSVFHERIANAMSRFL